jgi:TolB protein
MISIPRLILVLSSAAAYAQSNQSLGIFENHSDVGAVLTPGTAEYDAAKNSFTVTGSGENMWAAADAFHFVWKKVHGDMMLTADVWFDSTTGNAHKKAVLLVRQSLEPGSVYADAALHGEGLTSLQARDENGAATHEVQSNIKGPKRLRIEKRGQYVYMSLSAAGEEPRMSGGSMKVNIEGDYYVGLGVCSHDKNAVAKAFFSNVRIAAPPDGKPVLYSTLETITVTSTDRRVVAVSTSRLESPNWSRDGKSLLYTESGKLMRIPVEGGASEALPLQKVTRVTQSPDGKQLAFTSNSRVEVMLTDGGAQRVITPAASSDFGGWSPDAKTILFSAVRKGKTDIYTIALDAATESKLTNGEGRNLSPEYSPDGAFVFFISDRSGTMQIWRMQANGSNPEQVFQDDFNNYSPHVSPDGRRLVFLSYPKGAPSPARDKEVLLRMISLADKKLGILGKIVGGQGTIDSTSWSPDGRRLAFVSYQNYMK